MLNVENVCCFNKEFNEFLYEYKSRNFTRQDTYQLLCRCYSKFFEESLPNNLSNYF